jgi:hypothetical protein
MKGTVSILFSVLVFLLSATGASAQTAQEIIRSSRERIVFETKSVRSRMVIAAKDGTTTERLVDQYTQEGGGPIRKLFIFLRPASVANTRFLTIENPGGGEDRWIFLPALGRVRRIAAGEGSGSFLGTDMSYDDISSTDRDPDADEHRLLREEKLGDEECWVVDSVPKDQSYQYSRMVSWIAKATRLSLRIELFDKRGELAKVMEVLATEEAQGRLTATATKMSTVKAMTSTTVYADIVKYDDPIPAGVFTTRFLERKRP